MSAQRELVPARAGSRDQIAEAPAWHTLPAAEALARLGSDGAHGLESAEAERRLARHGANQLELAAPRPWWLLLADQLRSVVVALLLVATVAAFVIGDRLEAAAIGAVLAFNVTIGFWLEWRARVAMEALRRLEAPAARVLRDGEPHTIDARRLVPGDVIVLGAGDSVPADARLLDSAELRLVEAPLTGESVPVAKDVAAVAPTPLAERSSMVYKGTAVADGDARAVVVATGRNTEIGRIGELVASTPEERTPLEKRLDQLGRRLVWITLVIAAAVALSGLARGRETWLMVETALALAIAAVPEGLPAVTTVTLALGMRRMARRNALVRRLPAVETLGSVTVVCADKTGTLTIGEMTVDRLVIGDRTYRFDGSGGGVSLDGRRVSVDDDPELERAAAILALASSARLESGPDGEHVIGDPMEGALLRAAAQAGIDRRRQRRQRPELARVPFSSERMLMATTHAWDDEAGGEAAAPGHRARRLLVKGAPERLLPRCTQRLDGGRAVPLDDTGRERVLEHNRRLASEGLRVLALADRELPAVEIGDEAGDETAVADLTLVGLVGLLDPPAPTVRNTVERLRRAGIRVLMITGDQQPTAEAIAAQVGILEPGDEVLDATELESLTGDQLAARLDRVVGFARISPADKLHVIEALARRGEIVGMLGDGVNDAPALKRADIGVAMGGRGTDVAKESADLVLQDDRLETVAVAVEEGRVIFDNLRKFIFYLFSCNLSEVSVLLVSGLAGLPLPLLPLQILWLNLVTDVFPAFALAVEPAEPNVMERPPRSPHAAILSRSFVLAVGGYSATITAATLGAFLAALHRDGAATTRAVTIAFMTLALAQLFHVFNARSEEPVLFGRRLLGNPWAWGAIVLTIALQLVAVYQPGLARILDTQPLDRSDWALVAPCALAPLVSGQLWKLLRRRTRAGGSAPAA